MLKEDVIRKRIYRAIRNHEQLSKESLEVKGWFSSLIQEEFKILDRYVKTRSSTENLRLIMSCILDTGYSMFIKDAKWYEKRKNGNI